MSRYPVGLTLSASERCQVGAPARSGAMLVRSYVCDVTMPDRSPCTVTYTRFSGTSHQLDYGPPVSQRVWVNHRIHEGVAGVEEAACGNAAFAFHLAQEAEQKEMRRKTPPQGTPAHTPVNDALLDRAKADRFAGQYAVCVRFASGRLMKIGHAYEQAEQAQHELHAGCYGLQGDSGAQLVIGICNRWARRWQEPRFLVHVPVERRAATETIAPPSLPTKPVKSAAPNAPAPPDPAFGQWMSEVEEILDEHTGMTTADLRHCRYRDWYEGSYTPEEAAREALGTNGYDDNVDEPFRPV